jgi:hypothetical protein
VHILWAAICKCPIVLQHCLVAGSYMADLMQTLMLTLFQANEHHRKYLESLPSTPYPLRPTRDSAEVGEPQKVTDEPIAQR